MSDIRIPTVHGMTIPPVSEEQAAELVGKPPFVMILDGDYQQDLAQKGTKRIFGRELIPIRHFSFEWVEGIHGLEGPFLEWYSPTGTIFIIYAEGNQKIYEGWIDEDDEPSYRLWQIVPPR